MKGRTLWRTFDKLSSGVRMASNGGGAVKIHEGVFAINKPTGISSAQVIRDVQSHFKPSTLFEPWLAREQARKDAESHNQKRKRKSWKQRQPLQVKMGHGGTLDPEASGVLILGVGSGTKALNNFLACTKSYDAVLLFGVASDSYDAVGKRVAEKPYDHITKDAVEEALSKFRGKIMQRPPIFSALRVQGKRLYEYAREGIEVPVEIQERPVEVLSLEMVEWMPGGTHDYHWPTEEAEAQEKDVARNMFNLKEGDASSGATSTGAKRKRDVDDNNRDTGDDESAISKRSKPSPVQADTPEGRTTADTNADASSDQQHSKSQSQPNPRCPAPAVRLRMEVTSGFYVRSLCHDLGGAVDSLGLMASLVRTRQGDFKIGKNVLEYDDLAKGEDAWAPKIAKMLDDWKTSHGGSDSEGENGSSRGMGSIRSHRSPESISKIKDGQARRRNSSSEED